MLLEQLAEIKRLEVDWKRIFRNTLFGYLKARSYQFLLQYEFFNRFSQLPPQTKGARPQSSPEIHKAVLKGLNDLFLQDASQIADGVYPIGVLKPESPRKFFSKTPKLLWDGLFLYHRRFKKEVSQFSSKAKKWLPEVPEYYQRNFHFQTDGYLSAHSAALYDYQVDMLFAGATDAMRRMILLPMKKHTQFSQGQKLRFLELGSGTGRTSLFVHQAFPEAEITLVDLSAPYLKESQQLLKRAQGINFMRADAAHLPLKEDQYDCVYTTFLFHELPTEVRQEVIHEMYRVLKPKGLVCIVDSIQKGDIKKLDPLLKEFPKNYHEPYFLSYTRTPLEGLLKTADFQEIQPGTRYLAKSLVAEKP